MGWSASHSSGRKTSGAACLGPRPPHRPCAKCPPRAHTLLARPTASSQGCRLRAAAKGGKMKCMTGACGGGLPTVPGSTWEGAPMCEVPCLLTDAWQISPQGEYRCHCSHFQMRRLRPRVL